MALMTLCLGYYLDCARAIELIAEHDTSKAFVLMGKSLTLLGRDLHLNCTDIARNPELNTSEPSSAQSSPRAVTAGIRVSDVD